MQPKQPIHSDGAVTPRGAYSQAIRRGNIIMTAGLGPQDAVTGRVVGEDIEAQTRQVLASLRAVLREAGAGFEDVIKVTVHLQHLERDFPAFNRVYGEVMPEPWPARTTVGSTLAGILVEIDMVAVLG